MAIFTTIAAGAGAAKATGINFSGVKNFVGGIFGGSKSPNYGTSDFVDALDNYEAVSTKRAFEMQGEIEQLLRRGGSDRQVGQIIANEYGESNPSGVMSSRKWPIVKNFLDQARQNIRSAGSSGASAAMMQTGQAGSGSAGLGLFRSPVIWGAIGLIGFLLLRN